MKTYILLLALVTCLFYSCNDNDNGTQNPLSDLGLLGDWDISGRGIDNVSSLEALCCESITFSDDSNTNDLKGTYVSDDSSGIITNGTFTVDIEANSIVYTTENDNTYALEFTIDNDVLEVWYFEDGARYWTSYAK